MISNGVGLLQGKPVPPPCGTTTPGCTFMTTPQRESLRSSSRTLCTPCSPMPASSSCSGTLWKGGGIHPCDAIDFNFILQMRFPGLLYRRISLFLRDSVNLWKGFHCSSKICFPYWHMGNSVPWKWIHWDPGSVSSLTGGTLDQHNSPLPSGKDD